MLARDIHSSIDAYRTGAKLLDFSLEQAQHIMGSDEYFKFTVVRDPFERLVSAYIEKFVINRTNPGNQHHTGPVVAAVQQSPTPDFETGISFADFIAFITAQAPENLDPHWTPQTRYLSGIEYDRIYRMDEIDVLRRDLEARIGLPVDLEHRNRSRIGRPLCIPGSSHRLPGELKDPKRLDKLSFMESEIMFRVATYFADDYRLYYPEGRTSPATKTADHPVSEDRHRLWRFLDRRFLKSLGHRSKRGDGG